MSDSKHHKLDPNQDGAKQGHSSYWRFAHHDWRFWLGLILIFTAMFIYLMTEDLSWRPRQQPSEARSGGDGVSGK
jgi:hypothetical protein